MSHFPQTKSWLIDFELRNIVNKIKDYKLNQGFSIDMPIFQKLIDVTLSQDPILYDENLLNLIKIEEADDFVYIAIIHAFNKIFSFVSNTYSIGEIRNESWISQKLLKNLIDEISAIHITENNNFSIFLQKYLEVIVYIYFQFPFFIKKLIRIILKMHNFIDIELMEKTWTIFKEYNSSTTLDFGLKEFARDVFLFSFQEYFFALLKEAEDEEHKRKLYCIISILI